MIKGQGVSRGFGIGKVYVYDNTFVIPSHNITDIDSEIDKLKVCIESSITQLDDLYEENREKIGDEKAQIFKAHGLMLSDPEFINHIEKKIKSGINAPMATKETSDFFENMFSMMDNEYFRERALDIKDVSTRLIKNLLGVKSKNLKDLTKGSVVVAHDLAPSDTAALNKENIAGIITEIGGQTSHSAIIARTLDIPAVMGIGKNIKELTEGMEIIVDGDEGLILLSPTEEQATEYKAKIEKREEENKALLIYKDMHFKYSDGRSIEIAGNIASSEEASLVVDNGGEGVGLFRSEFLYMNRSGAPTEDEQFKSYKEAIELMAPHPLTIRTMDIGGDKEVSYLSIDKELNPFLGYRAIRYCFDHVDLFKTQLKALYRASAYGKLRIMFPMISSITEVRKVKEIIEEVKAELRDNDVKFDEAVEIGIMIEIPSAALMADVLADEVDFASIGTNDLTQYTLASDRMNPKVEHIYSNFDPSIVRLVWHTIKNFHAKGKWVGMCGSAAGNPLLIPVWYAMNMDEYSMSPSSILTAKKIINSITDENISGLLDKVLSIGSKEEMKEFLKEFSSELK